MGTCDDYKSHIKAINGVGKIKISLEETENLFIIIVAMIEQRNALGISQRDLASMCGIPQSSVARIESFKTTPNLATILKIMRSLGLKLSVSTTAD